MAEVSPAPNVDVPAINKRVFFEIDKSVPDTFWDRHSELKPLNIKMWRKSLENGFLNSFSEFNIVNKKEDADIIFKIYKALPERTLVSVSQSGQQYYPLGGSDTTKTVVVSAQLTYQARLLNAQGDILKRSTGTSISKKRGTKKNESGIIIASAVESMYESIAMDFFQ
ncbi:hypothetical protein [uncultured Desulfuromonas sp.]|uniref:hypothetical protein n=1 Tax=uncultured Desulfuromonas sp. TaxID=181013 RepID=UPI002AAB9132|nr:hypothetical protein [uncultured Desulfuromonas sp.]